MRKGAVIAIIIIAVVVVGGLVGFLVWNNSNSGNSSGGNFSVSGGGTSGQGLSFEENQQEQQEVIRGIAMPGWDTMQVTANTKNVTVDLYNPTENEGKYYLTFEIQLPDTGETLYKSGLVKPGDHVRQIELSRALSPGTYNAVVFIQPYSADSNLTAKNNGKVAFKLIAVEV